MNLIVCILCKHKYSTAAMVIAKYHFKEAMCLKNKIIYIYRFCRITTGIYLIIKIISITE